MKKYWWCFWVAYLIFIITLIILALDNRKLREEAKALKKEVKVYGELSTSLLKQLEKAEGKLKGTYDLVITFGQWLYTLSPSYKVLKNIKDLNDAKTSITNDSIIYGNLRKQLEKKGYYSNRALLESLGKEASGKDFQGLGF